MWLPISLLSPTIVAGAQSIWTGRPECLQNAIELFKSESPLESILQWQQESTLGTSTKIIIISINELNIK